MDVAPDPCLQLIAQGVYAWIGAKGDSNAGAVVSPQGLIAIDAQQTAALGKSFRSALEGSAGRPVTRLVNTHLHLDHTAGNVAFAGLPILAHEETGAGMRAELGASAEGSWLIAASEPKLRLFFGSNIGELLQPGSAEESWFVQRVGGPDYQEIVLVAPTEEFADRYVMHLPGDRLRLEYWGPSHCAGHLVIWLEAARVAFLGDLLFVGRFPWLGDCDLDGWIGCLDRILKHDLLTVVPGHGPVATLGEVAEFRALLSDLREAVAAAIRQGISEDGAAAQISLPQYAGMPRYREWMPLNVRAAYRYLKAR